MKLSVDYNQESKFSLWCPEEKTCSGLPVMSLVRLPVLSLGRLESITQLGLNHVGRALDLKSDPPLTYGVGELRSLPT